MVLLLAISSLHWACHDQLDEISSQQTVGEQSSTSPTASPSICTNAIAHVEACIGRSVDQLGETCDPLDAELLLEGSPEYELWPDWGAQPAESRIFLVLVDSELQNS